MLPPLKFLKARGPHYIFKAIEECSSMNSSLISSLEMNFHKNFFKFKFPNSIWIRLDRFNETHWADRKGNKIILYNVTQPMFNGFHISSTAGNFNPGKIFKISPSWMIGSDQKPYRSDLYGPYGGPKFRSDFYLARSVVRRQS